MNLKTDVDYIAIEGWSSLKQFGINALTGEGCAFALRLTCDLNEDGLALMADYLGIPDLKPAAPWNSSVNDKPTVGSILIARNELQSLATFALFRIGALATCEMGFTLMGLFSEELLAKYREHEVGTVRANPAIRTGNPIEGSRNIHAMTGRAA